MEFFVEIESCAVTLVTWAFLFSQVESIALGYFLHQPVHVMMAVAIED